MVKRILFTGGTGKAGRHVLPWLLEQKYEILNFDLLPFPHPTIPTLVGDITEGAQVFNAMPTLKLTDRVCKGKRPPSSGYVELWDSNLPGFGMRINFGGKRSFQVMLVAQAA